jgi:hypothetical protein
VAGSFVVSMVMTRSGKYILPSHEKFMYIVMHNVPVSCDLRLLERLLFLSFVSADIFLFVRMLFGSRREVGKLISYTPVW